MIDRILTFLGVGSTTGDADDAPVEAEDVSDDAAEAALRAVLGDELGDLAAQLVREDGAEEFEEGADSSLYGLLQRMSVFQKIKLARLGNKEARSLLVRDRNKIVAMAAVSSPKMTDNEVVSIAQSRNVVEDVLRVIAMNRQWTRGYQVKLALATNPKCSQATALKFVNYLHDQDLRAIMRSKDVPSVVSTQARRILMKKGKL